MKLPQYSPKKKKGNIAADILKKNIQKIAIVNNHDESIDLGIDMRAQIITGSTPQPMFFNIQCKGTDEIDNQTISNNYLSVSIKTTTINFWRQQNELTFLFVVDIITEICYWVDPLKSVLNKIESIQDQQTVQIRVPKSNAIDSNIQQVPEEWIADILLHIARQDNLKITLLEQTVEEVSKKFNLSIETTVLLLKEVKKSADKANQSFYKTCNILIENIQKQMRRLYEYLVQLDHMGDVVRRWCPEGIFASKSFSRKNLCITELTQEMNAVIDQFKKNPDDINILNKLVECNMEINYTLTNLRGFLYEMACEDNPNGDQGELFELVFNDKSYAYK